MIPDYLSKWKQEVENKINELNETLEKNKGLVEEYSTHMHLISEKINDSFQVFTPNKYEDENKILLKELTEKIRLLKAENEDITARLSNYEMRSNEITALKDYLYNAENKPTIEILKKEELQDICTNLSFCSQICYTDSQRCVLELKNIIELLNTKIKIME